MPESKMELEPSDAAPMDGATYRKLALNPVQPRTTVPLIPVPDDVAPEKLPEARPAPEQPPADVRSPQPTAAEKLPEPPVNVAPPAVKPPVEGLPASSRSGS